MEITTTKQELYVFFIYSTLFSAKTLTLFYLDDEMTNTLQWLKKYTHTHVHVMRCVGIGTVNN